MYSFKDLVVANDPRMGDDEWLEYMRQKRKQSDLVGISTEDNEFDEALTIQARQKLKQAMRKNKAKIMRARKIASNKKASKEKIEKRAKKQAIDIVKKKILKDKDPSDLSFAARSALEKRVKAKQGVIDKLSKRLVRKVKQDERERLKGKSSS